MENVKKPLCEFGTKCYRKNPRHFENYSHPQDLNIIDNGPLQKKAKREDAEFLKLNTPLKNLKGKKEMKQTTLNFGKKGNVKKNSKKLTQESNSKTIRASTTETKNTMHFRRKNNICNNKQQLKNNFNIEDLGTQTKKQPSVRKKTPKEKHTIYVEKNQQNLVHSKTIDEKIRIEKSENKCTDGTPDFDSDEESSDNETVQSTSWIFVKKTSDEYVTNKIEENFVAKTEKEVIKMLFLVDMPQDFYSFYEFCKLLNNKQPLNALEVCNLQLVGPFDILSGVRNYSVKKELILCHWRFYYDPPEFQTVLASHSGFHIGYWRDDPKEEPVFLASNNPNKDCIFNIEYENIFGTVFNYLGEFHKSCDPFTKIKITKLQNALTEWSEKNNFCLNKNSNKITGRQKKVVSKTLHKAGIVVPLQPKTEIGYRPLIETEANLKKICNVIIQAKDEAERESLFDNLQPLITAANIANDECDFGNSLELGIDLFCMGSPVFHETAEHLLTTAYSLLNRNEFEEIIRAHLKNRRKGNNLNAF